jgi:hypothetical protein
VRQRLRIVRSGEAVAAVMPWWRAPWLAIMGRVVWWLLTFAFGLAVAVVIAALLIIVGILKAVGVMAHFAGESR